MNLLKDTQVNFQSYLFEGNRNIFSDILGRDQDFIRSRLNIYADGYFIRLSEILKMNYPCLYRCLGEDLFLEMNEAYIRACPSKNFSIAHFGKDLNEFLMENSFGMEKLALADLAKFEFNLVSVVTAQDAKIKTVKDLESIAENNWPRLKFKFHPSLKIETFDYNVADYVQDFLDQELRLDLHKLKEAQTVIFWRDPIYNARFLLLSDAQRFIFKSCIEDKNFSEICEGLVECIPVEKLAEYAMNQLVWMLNNGLLCYCGC